MRGTLFYCPNDSVIQCFFSYAYMNKREKETTAPKSTPQQLLKKGFLGFSCLIDFHVPQNLTF